MHPNLSTFSCLLLFSHFLQDKRASLAGQETLSGTPPPGNRSTSELAMAESPFISGTFAEEETTPAAPVKRSAEDALEADLYGQDVISSVAADETAKRRKQEEPALLPDQSPSAATEQTPSPARKGMKLLLSHS